MTLQITVSLATPPVRRTVPSTGPWRLGPQSRDAAVLLSAVKHNGRMDRAPRSEIGVG